MPAGSRTTTAVSDPDTPTEQGFVSFLDVAGTPWRRLPNFPSYKGAEQRAGMNWPT